MYKFLTQKVYLLKIRHNDCKYYLAEGYGGKSLEYWPVTVFYKKFISGNTMQAAIDFTDWYEVQLDKYATKSKSDGGMKNGSLYRLIEKRTGKNFDNSSKQERRKIIEERVTQRFNLLVDIQKNGYCPVKAEQIFAFKRDDLIYLKGGHHRAAALLALGEESIPDILVFPSQLVYNVFAYIRKIKQYGNF
jgi:hypothetical protein